MFTRKFKYKAAAVALSAVLMLPGAVYAIDDAFSEDLDDVSESYAEEFGWDTSLYDAYSWEDVFPSGSSITVTRQVNYQMDYYRDLLGQLAETMGVTITYSGWFEPFITTVAINEIAKEGVDPDFYITDLHGKYLITPTSKDLAFLLWCAIESKSSMAVPAISKTTEQFRNTLIKWGYKRFDAPDGFTDDEEQKTRAGDLFFIPDGETYKVGLVTLANTDTLTVVMPDESGAIKKFTYDKDQASVGEIIRLTYPEGRDPSMVIAGLIWPLKNWTAITSPFAEIDPIRNNSPHKGIDIGAVTGTPVLAAASGKIVSAGSAGHYGNMVMIDHGDGYYTLYAHNSAILCKVGDSVNQGDAISLVGSTGNSTGPHLHFEVREGNKPLDPLLFVSEPKRD